MDGAFLIFSIGATGWGDGDGAGVDEGEGGFFVGPAQAAAQRPSPLSGKIYTILCLRSLLSTCDVI